VCETLGVARSNIGEAVHRGRAYPGEHQPIITRDLWNKVHSILGESPRKRAGQSRLQTPALLKGLIFAPNGQAMSPTHTRKGGRLYRYYVTQSVLKLGPDTCPIRRIPAGEIEAAVVDQLRAVLASPEMIVWTWREAREAAADAAAVMIDRSDGYPNSSTVDVLVSGPGAISEAEIRDALLRLDPLWDELFPTEQARITQLLVERVDVGLDGARIRLRTDGLASLAGELGSIGIR